MKERMKKTLALLILLPIAVATCLFGYWIYRRNLSTYHKDRIYDNIEERAEEAYHYAKSHGLSENYCILVDYSIPSGTPRVFIWDFRKHCIAGRTYCMHGDGKGKSTPQKPVFSNKLGSQCSSLGHFAVTKEHGHINKTGFRLKGLDQDNQTAYARALMIHSSLLVDLNCWRKYLPVNSRACQGCVTVSSKGMRFISRIVNSEKKQILMWNYV